jgi:small subunit ribosomal protein S9
MKPPEEVFPQRKAAEFDETGRPHHSLFYTSKPNFFQFLHDIVAHTLECNKFEDRMIRQQKTADPALQIDLTGKQWISKDQLELRLVENIRDLEYSNFVNAITRLANHPYSYRSKDFIEKYSRPLLNQTITLDIPKPQVDEDGKSFITVYGELCNALIESRSRHRDYRPIIINLNKMSSECLRKRARGDVTLKAPGTGKISINGQPISYFEYDQSREQVSR